MKKFSIWDRLLGRDYDYLMELARGLGKKSTFYYLNDKVSQENS